MASVRRSRGGIQENPAIPSFRTLGLSERMEGPIRTRTLCTDICRERQGRRKEEVTKETDEEW
jgi:hypothetical protein